MVNPNVTFSKSNGNSKWDSAEKLELTQLHDYKTFKDLGKKPNGYRKIKVRFVYDVKYDGRHNA